MYRVIAPALALAMCLSSPVLAGDPVPFADFTFKRVKPPKPGATRRITVQIAPVAVPRISPNATPAKPGPDAPAAPRDALDWFWKDVPVGGSGLGGVGHALTVLRNAPGRGVAAPRLDSLRRIADRHGREILLATIGTRVSPAFVLAVIAVESGGRPDARSTAGAHGLMQLMPATAARFGVTDRSDAPQNIRGGVTYLNWLMGEFDNDPLLALAGYNAGEGAVRKYAGVPPYSETRAYIPKVLAAWSVARGLCLTPPQFVTDGCVFLGQGAATRG